MNQRQRRNKVLPSWLVLPCYNPPMDPIARKFSSHAAADAADRAYYRSLTPDQRLDILLTLIERGKQPHEIGQKPARVYRIVKLPRR
jgi:hypothetical protein